MYDTLTGDFPNNVNYAHVPEIKHFWSLPLGLDLKLNLDGCSLGNSGPIGFGGLISDTSGACMVAYLGPLGYEDSISVETKAILFGLRL